jgi:hypothetical protein
MRRREFIAGIGSAAAWPLAARAQQSGRMRRVGVLMNGAATQTEYQFPIDDGCLSEIGLLMAPPLGATLGVTAPARAGAFLLQQVTPTLPIVFVNTNDPVLLELPAFAEEDLNCGLQPRPDRLHLHTGRSAEAGSHTRGAKQCVRLT